MVTNVAGMDANMRRSLSALSSANDGTIVDLWADPTTHRLLVDDSGGGGGLTILPATGTINNSNTSFTFTTLPSVIVINGGVYQQTGGAITWTWTSGTLTATLSSPVGTGGSVFGIQ